MGAIEVNGELRIVPVDTTNREPFDRLIQCYECEFSAITEKQPTADGVFPLDTHLDDDHKGFLAYLGEIPVGFNVIALKGNGHYEVCEFFIVPLFRTRRLGYYLAAAIFDRYRGKWEVKQIAGAGPSAATRTAHTWKTSTATLTGGR